MKELEKIKYKINLKCQKEVVVKLGGETSFDIFPKGWDKTYGLKHYPDAEIYFTGDRCEKGGNDWHIYEALKSESRSFHIHSTDETIKLINGFIEDLQA